LWHKKTEEKAKTNPTSELFKKKKMPKIQTLHCHIPAFINTCLHTQQFIIFQKTLQYITAILACHGERFLKCLFLILTFKQKKNNLSVFL